MSEKHDAMWGAEAGGRIEQLEVEIQCLRALNAELVGTLEELQDAREKHDAMWGGRRLLW
jgi:hypothetical protein